MAIVMVTGDGGGDDRDDGDVSGVVMSPQGFLYARNLGLAGPRHVACKQDLANIKGAVPEELAANTC
eukprot:3959610-Alexandrium_andersonii.AAC.1